MLNIFITNLGKYNEGELVGKWLQLPATKKEIADVIKKIGIDGVKYEEYFITDYETDIEGIEISEYSNITELNKIAEKIEELDGNQLLIIDSLIEWGMYSDILEALENVNNYSLIEDIEDEYELGYHFVNELGCYDIPENLKNYIDYESLGRDITFEGAGFLSSNGWIEEV